MRRENAGVNGVEDYRERLLTRKMELLLSLRIRPETLAGPGAVAVEDLAPVFHEQFVALQINQLDLLQLKLVDAALDRMDSEDYGSAWIVEIPFPTGAWRRFHGRTVALPARSARLRGRSRRSLSR